MIGCCRSRVPHVQLLAPLSRLFLQAAHDNGLLTIAILTPANLMVVDPDTEHETIKVMDFGLSRRIGFYIPSGHLNSDSSPIDGGTPDYICPEQIEGRQVDHRGDLFSVGVLLYGLLTGHLPFETMNDPNEILVANDPPSGPPRPSRTRQACDRQSVHDRGASAQLSEQVPCQSSRVGPRTDGGVSTCRRQAVCR